MKKGLLIAIIILVIFSRFAFLELRPLHHDEGVNYFFADNILTGEGFRYDPSNYHGPFYFFMLALSFLILGINEFSLRLPAVIAGIGVVLAPLLFGVWDRHKPYVCSLFLLFMPSLIYYSRYSIHESCFVLFSMISVYLLTKILEEKNLEKLPYLVLCVAFLFAIKETVLIFLFGVFLMSIANIKEVKQICFGKREKRIVLLSIIVFIGVYVLFFSSFFSNLNGITDSFKGFMPWIERGMSEKGHDKVFYYYFLLLLKYELPLLILGIIALFSFKRLKESIFAKNVMIWFVSSFLVYSIIGYKTPWLIINMSVPLAMLAGIGIGEITKTLSPRVGFWDAQKSELVRISDIKSKNARYILLFLSLVYLAFFSAYLNFYVPWQKTNDYAYVHTDVDILNMARDIKREVPADASILVTSKDYWPLPFYLREYKKVFYTEGKFAKEYFDVYDLLIIDIEEIKKQGLDESYYGKKYKLREGVELVFARKVK